MTVDYTSQRQERQLSHATTEPQRARMRELFALDKDAWAEKRQGKSVIAEFRRYVETCDPEKIGQGLYAFSTSSPLNDIAHFNLHGFRHVWDHPALYIQELLIPATASCRAENWPESFHADPEDYYWLHVYTDGLTSGDIVCAIVAIAAEHRDRVLADWQTKHDAAALAEATRLAESLGMKLVAA
jgi:hypothetical protein